jgi:hypothetical protein
MLKRGRSLGAQSLRTALLNSIRSVLKECFSMRTMVKIVLWTTGSLTLMAGTNLLGIGLFGPAVASGNVPMEAGVQLWMQQMLAVLGGGERALAAGAVCILVCIVCQKTVRQLRQAESDALAEKILREVREGQPPSKPYFLYLRAFETTKHLMAPLFLLDLATFGLNRLWSGELESFLSGALRKTGPLIALGHPGENLGAGRAITTDEAWKDDIAKLAGGAGGILLIPSHRPGTVWEIEHLEKADLLSRTVFVMPPESRRFNWRSHWSQARKAMGTLGAALPEYEELGMVFRLDAVEGVRGVEPFSLFFMRSLRKSILKLLLQKPEPEMNVDQAIRKARRRAGRWRLFGRVNVLIRAGALGIFLLMMVVGGRAAPPKQGKLPWAEFWKEFSTSALIDEREQSITGYFNDSKSYRELAKTLTLEQENRLRAEMMHAGFRRLDDQQLRWAYLAFSRLLEQSDAATCGAIATHSLSPDQLDRALWKVDEELVTNWLDMNREAAIAEIEEKPIPAVSYTTLMEARRRFEESLKPEELSRYRGLAARGAERTAEDECWMARMKFGAIRKLPEPYSLVWARLLEFEGERPVSLGLVKNPFEKLKALPAFQQRALGMTDEQKSDLFGDLVGKGTARLDDSTLLGRFAALGDVLAKADEATCEAISEGKAAVEQFETALGQISEQGQSVFLDSQYRAAVAELQQIKPVLLSKDETEAAEIRMGSALNAQEKEQVNAPNKAAGNSHADSCWKARKAYAAVTELEEPYNRMWARVVSQQ